MIFSTIEENLSLSGFRKFMAVSVAFLLLPVLITIIAFLIGRWWIDTQAVVNTVVMGYIISANFSAPFLILFSLLWVVVEIVNGLLKLIRYARRTKNQLGGCYIRWFVNYAIALILVLPLEAYSVEVSASLRAKQSNPGQRLSASAMDRHGGQRPPRDDAAAIC
jgi:hypothetical protein